MQVTQSFISHLKKPTLLKISSEIAEDWLSSIILHKRLSIKMNSYLLLTLLLLFLVTFIIPLILRITLNSPTTVAIINKPVVNEFKNISA